MPELTTQNSGLRIQNPELRTQSGRLRSLLTGREGLGITVPRGLLPEFLLEANNLVRSGRRQEARGLLTEANIGLVEERVAGDGSLTDLMYVLARLLVEVGEYAAAEPWYRRIVSIEPHAQVWADLARVCSEGSTVRLGEVMSCWEQAHLLDAENVVFKEAYADHLVQFGRVAQGVALFEQIIQENPDRLDLILRWLWNLHYLPGTDRAFFFEQYSRLGRQLEHLAGQRAVSSWTRPFDPDRRLRVGILSGDFRSNSPSSGYEPFMELCDRRGFELFGYGSVKDPDDVTDRIAGLFDTYRDIHGRPDDQVADQIREDGIDILVEIGGYSAGHRLGVFLRSPAPAQVDLGGIGTRGLTRIGHRITDEVLDPPDTQRFSAERLVYLPGGGVPYRPPSESPLVGPLPATRSGHVTFGSFNNYRKVSGMVLSLWSRILTETPGARMVLKFPTAADPAVREDLYQRFEQEGIDRGRVRLCGPTSYFDHLSLLEQVDLLLDCFPFNGCRTTVEGLWMGVPTVTLSGPTFVANMGKDILLRLGLEAFVADSPEQYVCKAIAFASQVDALARIRRSLRSLMLSSSLCDPARFTREMEQALRQIWRSCCSQQNAETPSQRT